ncbi:MAG: glycosyltransferase family 2 protein [Burkholderiaceae bacterium]
MPDSAFGAAGSMSYTVVIPVLNQLHYTQQCVSSLLAHGVAPDALLVIDNGSTDGTPAWLASRPDLRSVRNAVNLGCGGAWTQGAMLSDGGWVVLLNNDIVCAHNFIEAQIAAAEREALEVVSPSMVEFELDYDLNAFTTEFLRKMAGTVRRAWFHGVCFSVKRSVFHRIGFLDTDRLLFGREDAEFLARCRNNGIAVGTVGDALLHHFGSITQKAMKKEQGVNEFGDHHYLYAKLGLDWWGRQRAKFERKARTARWVRDEHARHGLTLHMVHRDGKIEYR